MTELAIRLLMIVIILIIKVNDDDYDGDDDYVGDDRACQEVARPQPLPVPPRALEQPGQPVQVLLPSTLHQQSTLSFTQVLRQLRSGRLDTKKYRRRFVTEEAGHWPIIFLIKCRQRNNTLLAECSRINWVRAMAEVSVPDPASKAGRQLGACWGPGNSLLLHAKKSRTGEQQHGAGGEQARVHEVRWETTLYEPVFRKLVNESLGIFLSLQKLAEEEAGVVADQLVRQSSCSRSR